MNNYHIYEEEAKGKYSVIFKARKKKKLDFVAIKRMEKTRKAKLSNEAKILPTLQHPNILKFYDSMETKNHLWAVTQYCPGRDLQKIIEEDKALPEHTVRGFVLQILNGMQYCHSKGIVICDIKPASILLNEYGNTKLADFGTAQRLSDLAKSDDSKTKKKGTPSYMAPELFQIGGVYSFASDFWALGCLMHELGQGNPPFVSTGFQEIARLAKEAPTPKIENFSSDFNSLLAKLLIKDPAERIEWQQLRREPWIRGEIPEVSIPTQKHFQDYMKNRKKGKVENLRVSRNFEGYGISASDKADDRRSQFIFEADNLEDINRQENEYLQEQQEFENFELPISASKKQQKELQPHSFKKKPSSSRNQNASQIPMNKKLEDSSNLNIFMDTLTAKPTVSIEQALTHQSDTAVKPIIGNKDIELIQSFTFNKKNLGFKYIEPDVLAEHILNGEKEKELDEILAAMKGDQKENVLGYFESLVQNSEIANYLFKSTFIPYYMGLIKWYRHSSLRAKICEIVGFLIRHATSIDSDILKFGIIQGFVEAATKDKSQKVRRKAMAALGQLLFYGATQVDEDALEWDISISLISTLQKILKNTNEDQIVRVYCCKSIQNITAQAQKVGLNFSQLDMLQTMVFCFNETQNEGFRTSIMSCIHHMITLNPTLLEFFFERMSIDKVIEAIESSETYTKTNQILLWVLLQQLNKSLKAKISKQLILENRNLLKAVVGLLETGGSVVKGRVYLFVYLVLMADFKKVTFLTDSKLFQAIERHGKDTGKYESQALQFVVATLYQNFEKVLLYAKEEVQMTFEQASSKKDISDAKKGNKPFEKNNFIVILNFMKNCHAFQQAFNKAENIEIILSMLNLVEVKIPTTASTPVESKQNYFLQDYLDSFKNHLFSTLQAIFSNNSTTERLQEFYCGSVLPFLIGKIIKSHQNDIKFVCMQYFIGLVRFCLSEEYLYDSTILTETSTKIVALIQNHLIPQFDYLLEKEEQTISQHHGQKQMPLIFKLISSIFEISHSFVDAYCMVSSPSEKNSGYRIINFFTPQAGQPILRTMCSLTKSPKLQLSQSGKFMLYGRAVDVLQNCCTGGHQNLIEYPLTILINLIEAETKRYQKAQEEGCETILGMSQHQVDVIFEHVIKLQSHDDLVVKANSEKLIALILQRSQWSKQGLNDWRKLSKQGYENYELFVRLSGLKTNNKASELREGTFKRETNRYT